MAALNLRYAVGLIINNLAQFSTLLTKLQGVLMLWKLNQARALSLAFGVLAKRKSKIKRKVLHKQIRRLQRKDRSIWYKPGRTDLWWQIFAWALLRRGAGNNSLGWTEIFFINC